MHDDGGFALHAFVTFCECTILGRNLLQYVTITLAVCVCVSFFLSYLLYFLCVCACNCFVWLAAADSKHDGTAVGLSSSELSSTKKNSYTPKANSQAKRNIHVEVHVVRWCPF